MQALNVAIIAPAYSLLFIRGNQRLTIFTHDFQMQLLCVGRQH